MSMYSLPIPLGYIRNTSKWLYISRVSSDPDWQTIAAPRLGSIVWESLTSICGRNTGTYYIVSSFQSCCAHCTHSHILTPWFFVRSFVFGFNKSVSKKLLYSRFLMTNPLQLGVFVHVSKPCHFSIRISSKAYNLKFVRGHIKNLYYEKVARPTRHRHFQVRQWHTDQRAFKASARHSGHRRYRNRSSDSWPSY